MKILAQYNPNSGGSYHRVKLWLEVKGGDYTLTEQITEEQLRGIDLVYVHWNLIGVSVPQMSVWKEKYGFKLVVDIDDTWDLETKYEVSVMQSQHLCILADCVICTTWPIHALVKPFNTNVTLVPNLIPLGHGQFHNKKLKTRTKIRIGIGGSISHYNDYLSLRSTIKYFDKQPWFKDQCEFAIIGYDGRDPLWKDVAKMFKDPIIFPAKSVESYMDLYDEIDIMLLPLEDTPVNRGRSGLKIYECLCKDIIPIVSRLYYDKVPMDVYTHLLIEDWRINITKVLIKSFDMKLGSKDLQSYVYGDWCIHNREVMFKAISNIYQHSNHQLWSITYLNTQDVEYDKYKNPIKHVARKSYLFEYNPILKLLERRIFSRLRYIGIFSHKFPFKTGYYKKYVEHLLDKTDTDVVVFCKQMPNYLKWTEQQHPGFLDLFCKICDKLGLEVREPKVTVYSNFFAAKQDVYQEYGKLLKSAIYLMDHDEEIKELVWKDPNYKTGLSNEDLKKFTGLDHYTFHTFILERLMSVWIDNKNLTYTIYE